MAPIGKREDERSATQAEETAPGERRELDDEQEDEERSERRAQPMAVLEPEVEGGENEERDDELDPEMVRVAGQRVRPEDLLRPTDGSEHVDPGLA